mgnify:CR=1 FL=1
MYARSLLLLLLLGIAYSQAALMFADVQNNNQLFFQTLDLSNGGVVLDSFVLPVDLSLPYYLFESNKTVFLIQAPNATAAPVLSTLDLKSGNTISEVSLGSQDEILFAFFDPQWQSVIVGTKTWQDVFPRLTVSAVDPHRGNQTVLFKSEQILVERVSNADYDTNAHVLVLEKRYRVNTTLTINLVSGETTDHLIPFLQNPQPFDYWPSCSGRSFSQSIIGLNATYTNSAYSALTAFSPTSNSFEQIGPWISVNPQYGYTAGCAVANNVFSVVGFVMPDSSTSRLLQWTIDTAAFNSFKLPFVPNSFWSLA